MSDKSRYIGAAVAIIGGALAIIVGIGTVFPAISIINTHFMRGLFSESLPLAMVTVALMAVPLCVGLVILSVGLTLLRKGMPAPPREDSSFLQNALRRSPRAIVSDLSQRLGFRHVFLFPVFYMVFGAVLFFVGLSEPIRFIYKTALPITVILFLFVALRKLIDKIRSKGSE